MVKNFVAPICVVLMVAAAAFLAAQKSGYAQSASSAATEQIKTKIDTARNNLRNMAVANEAYRVDWNKYTRSFGNLTTPIAYISYLPMDPFSKTSDTLKSAVVPPDRLALYSVGPDAKDDQAKVVYDPTNGLNSAGDIIRELSMSYTDASSTQSVTTSK